MSQCIAAGAGASSPKAELGREVLRAVLASCLAPQAQQLSAPVHLAAALGVPEPAAPASPTAGVVSVGSPFQLPTATSPAVVMGPCAEARPAMPTCPAPPVLPGVSVRTCPAEHPGVSAVAAAEPPSTPLLAAADERAAACGAGALALPSQGDALAEAQRVQQALPSQGDALAEAQRVQQEFTALAAGTNPGQRAYLERLSKAAAEAAARGYGVKRMTHTVRRTRVRKTTHTTDARTLETETSTEEKSTVDSWMEEGSPTVSGVGVMCARGTRVFDRFNDGSEVLQDAQLKGGAMFWLGGDATSMQSTSFNHRFDGSCRGDSQARWSRSQPPMARLAAA